MKKNGFTLVELLATIIILAIISTIAFVSYGSIQTKMKETALKNKTSYIENVATNYANETGNMVTNVQILVDEGYIQPDDNNGVVKNPVTDEEMNCLVVNIKEDQNNLYGELTDKKECDITNLEIVNRNLNIDVYEKGTNRKIAANEWTGKDVYLQVSFKDSSINKNNVKKITWISNSGREEVTINNNFDSNNRKEVTASLIINTTYKVEVLMADEVKYQAQTNVKIDKQRPVIYEAENYIENENNYTNSDKLVRVTATDFNGSGIAGYYIGTSNNCQTVSYEPSSNTNYEKRLDNGTYYVCVKDKVGNLSEDTSTKTITINRVDKVAPTVTFSGESTDWTKEDRIITLTCNDSGGSGCVENTRQIRYSTNTRTSTVEFEIKDLAGNVNKFTKTLNIYVDKCTATRTEYGSWGSCSEDCGGGSKSRSWTNYSTFGSNFNCDSGTDSESCNTHSCPSSGGDGGSSSGGGSGGSCCCSTSCTSNCCGSVFPVWGGGSLSASGTIVGYGCVC